MLACLQVCDVKDTEVQQVLQGRIQPAHDGTEAPTQAGAAASDAAPQAADADMLDEARDGVDAEPPLNGTVHEHSGWIAPKVWQKCANALSSRVLALLPDGVVHGGAGSGAIPAGPLMAEAAKCAMHAAACTLLVEHTTAMKVC